MHYGKQYKIVSFVLPSSSSPYFPLGITKSQKMVCLFKSLDNLAKFNTINNKLLNPPGTPLRNIPIKIYLPTTSPIPSSDAEAERIVQASVRTVQGLVPPYSASRKFRISFSSCSSPPPPYLQPADCILREGQSNTLGMALNQILPTVFPSRRNPVLAAPVLHGAVVPMSAPVEELMKAAAYTDGFLHIVVVML
jgi:autophagy-related protein 5